MFDSLDGFSASSVWFKNGDEDERGLEWLLNALYGCGFEADSGIWPIFWAVGVDVG